MDVAIREFPFVEKLPRREKSKLAQSWELLGEWQATLEKHGTVSPVALACKVLNLSRSRIDDICADGRLVRVTVDGHVFITMDSIVKFAEMERKNGRPVKMKQPTLKECFELGKEIVKELR